MENVTSGKTVDFAPFFQDFPGNYSRISTTQWYVHASKIGPANAIAC